MALLDNLNKDKNEYIRLKEKTSDIINMLDHDISYLDTPIANIGGGYKINGQSADKGIINDNQRKLISMRDYISNSVIPAIDDNINRLNREIQQEEERIRREEERRRAEEQARRKQEEEDRKKQEELKNQQKNMNISPTTHINKGKIQI